MYSLASKARLGIIAAVLTLGHAATAQQLNPGISCLTGEVPAFDFSELTSNYRESMWDTKAAMRLTSESTHLQLLVKDDYGSSVCEDIADMSVRCKFRFAANYSGLFNIVIDNSSSAVRSRYTLCAE